MKPREFQRMVMDWYRQHGRHDLPWRHSCHPYHVFLSELMLQQTQVPRVIGKFNLFLEKYPDFTALAAAPQSEILRNWKGLGYNRRALYLHQSAGIIAEEYAGRLPESEEQLTALPGIGPATARAMLAYAWNRAVVFIETNIRACLLHHFFPDADQVPDKDLEPIIAECLEGVEPRHWYSALMDYGTWLKKQIANPNRRSRHYSVQSKFEGSDRQLRGKVLDELLKREATAGQLEKAIPGEEPRLQRIIDGLVKEGFVAEDGVVYRLK